MEENHRASEEFGLRGIALGTFWGMIMTIHHEIGSGTGWEVDRGLVSSHLARRPLLRQFEQGRG